MYYYSLNNYLKKTFGQKLYKIALNGGFTCPTRDGTKGTGGCIFCAGGSGEFTFEEKDILVQAQKAKEKIRAKVTENMGYIAYFQIYTGTYAPAEYLRELYEKAISIPNVKVLSIATRPDCLSEEILNLLGEFRKKIPLWVELGFQTKNEKTARFIRRGYTNEIFEKAVRELSKRNIEVITHLIIGLPGETPDDVVCAANYAYLLGCKGVKLQLLHILEGTDLAYLYNQNKVKVMTKEEYINALCYIIERIPPDMVLHRITGDGAKRILIAPKWSGNKKDVLNSINKAFAQRDITQGRYFK